MEVVTTDEFLNWHDALKEKQHDAVYEIVELLAEVGISLGYPYSSDLKGAKHAFRELRKSAGKHEIRIIYAFDPTRNAVLILGGDKSGHKRFYEKIIPGAEAIGEQYLRERGGKDKP